MKNLSFLLPVATAILGILLTQLTKCNTVPTSDSNHNYLEIVEALNCTIDSLQLEAQSGDTTVVVLPALQSPVKYITRIRTQYRFDTIYKTPYTVPTPSYILDSLPYNWGGGDLIWATSDSTVNDSVRLSTYPFNRWAVDSAGVIHSLDTGRVWRIQDGYYYKSSPDVLSATPAYIEYNDDWISLMATKDDKQTEISLSVKDSLVQVVTMHRKWFLGRKHYTVITKSSNPYSIIQQQTYIFDRKSIRR